jgi:hypothetical protein
LQQFIGQEVLTDADTVYIRGITMATWKGYSKHQKVQVAILYIIWGLFGLAITILFISNAFKTIEYIYGLIAWTALAGIFAFVTWFILRKRSQQKTKVK